MTMAGMKRRERRPITMRVALEIAGGLLFAALASSSIVAGILWVIGETVEHFTK